MYVQMHIQEQEDVNMPPQVHIKSGQIPNLEAQRSIWEFLTWQPP